MKEIFEPIYGWGWYQGSPPRSVAVPEPFTVKIESESASEIEGIIEPTHVYSGQHVLLSLRSLPPIKKSWNVHITIPGQPQITGFAQSA